MVKVLNTIFRKWFIYNREVSLVLKVVKQLKELLLSDHEIGIISPYNGQVKQMRKALEQITKAEIMNTKNIQVKAYIY